MRLEDRGSPPSPDTSARSWSTSQRSSSRSPRSSDRRPDVSGPGRVALGAGRAPTSPPRSRSSLRSRTSRSEMGGVGPAAWPSRSGFHGWRTPLWMEFPFGLGRLIFERSGSARPSSTRGRVPPTTSREPASFRRCRSAWWSSADAFTIGQREPSAHRGDREFTSSVRGPGPSTLGGPHDRGCVSEAVCKPSSVPRALRRRGDGHPSMAGGYPTAHAADPRAGQRTSPPSRSPARVAPSYLALLRVEFAAFHSDRRLAPPAGIVTVALVLASRRTGVTRYPALRSSDFPHGETGLPAARATIRPPR